MATDECNDILTCSICLFAYDDNGHQPKLLPCHHSFCIDCLSQLAQAELAFDCPICRKRVLLTEPGGVQSLQTNFYVTHMKELLTLKRKKKSRGCKRHGSPLTLFCAKCAVSICVDCVDEEHKDPSAHPIQELESAITEQKRSVELEICEAQDTIMFKSSQAQHLEAEIGNLYAAKETTLSAIDKTFDTLIQALMRRRNKLKDHVNELHRSRRDALMRKLEEFRSQSSHLNTAIEQCETAIALGSMADVVSTRTLMRNKRNELSRNRQRPVVGPNYIKFDAKHGEERLLACLHDLGKIYADSMLPSIVDVKTEPATASLLCKVMMTLFSYNGDKLEQGKTDECPVSIEIKDPDETLLRTIISYRGSGGYEITYRPQMAGDHFLKVKFRGYHIKGGDHVISVESNNPVMKFGHKGDGGRGEFMYPRAVAVDHKHFIYVVDTGNCCIQKFNAEGEFITQFQVSKENDSISSCGIALNPDGNALICPEVCLDLSDLTSADAILLYSVDGKLLKRISDPQNLRRGLCVAVNSLGQIIMADFESNRLLMYDQHGRLLKRIGQAGSNAGCFNHPTFVCVGHDDRIIASDADNNRIQVFDKEGNYMYHFGAKGSAKGKLCQPFGVGADGHGNILVVDSGNKRIQVFKQDGTYVSSIESDSDKLSAPRGISVTGDGHVLVADRDNHCIKKDRYI